MIQSNDLLNDIETAVSIFWEKKSISLMVPGRVLVRITESI